MKIDNIVKFYEYLFKDNPIALNEIYQQACNFYQANINQVTSMEQFHDRKTKPTRT